MSEHEFVSFTYDPALCATCGEYHEQATPDGYVEAVWKVMLRLGVVDGDAFYGGPLRQPVGGWRRSNYHRTGETLEHLKTCAVKFTPTGKAKWAYTQAPDIGQVRAFAGTFAEGDSYRAALVGHLYCVCGHVSGEGWALEGMTIGQLIWHTVQEEQS